MNDEPKKEYIRLVSFPFSLEGPAREWLYTLPKVSVITWRQLQGKFLERYYPISRIQSARRKLSNMHIWNGESLYDYWNKFKLMLARCPNHNISDQDLIQHYVNELWPHDRQLLDAASDGSILNKQPDDAFQLQGEMAEDARDDNQVLNMIVHESLSKTWEESKLDNLCNTMQQMIEFIKLTMMKKGAKACQLC